MTRQEMEDELVALRALLKEAIHHGIHDAECQVWGLNPDDLEDEVKEAQACNCWLRYATKVVVEAEMAEAATAKAPGNCACSHVAYDHAKGDGFCTKANCACDKFTHQPRTA